MDLALETPGLLSLAAGFTDTESLPVDSFAEIVRRVTRRDGPPEYLQYGSNQGRSGLREAIAERLAQYDGGTPDAFDPDRAVVTNGSQQALQLASDVLCDAGDIVLVERPTYFVYLDVLRGLGVEPRSIPSDPESGRLDPEAFARMLTEMRDAGDHRRIKALYLISYFSNPASRSPEVDEKEELASVLQEAGLTIPVIEDAAYRELYYESAPAASSILSLEGFAKFPKLYLGTCTKPFATGLKVGYGYCSDEEWLRRILYLKGAHDFGTANLNQAVVEEALVSGAFERHLETIRPIYHRKMRALNEGLVESGLRELGWSWTVPAGGMYLWLRAPGEMETGFDSEFCRTCLEKGVLYVPGELCYGDRPERSFVRLSFGVLSEESLREAAQRFAEAARSLAA